MMLDWRGYGSSSDYCATRGERRKAIMGKRHCIRKVGPQVARGIQTLDLTLIDLGGGKGAKEEGKARGEVFLALCCSDKPWPTTFQVLVLHRSCFYSKPLKICRFLLLMAKTSPYC